MSERTTTTAPTKKKGAPSAAGAAAVPGAPSATGAKTDTGPIAVPPETPAPGPAADPEPRPGDGTAAEPPPGGHATKPVTVRPEVRGPRPGPVTRMGPWAPVAGVALGLLAGLVVVLLLRGAADDFADRLALVLAVVGLSMLGGAGTLLADEVQMIRQGAREAAVRPALVEATAPLLRGLTPARLLLLVSAFVLFLAAHVAR